MQKKFAVSEKKLQVEIQAFRDVLAERYLE